MDPHIADELRRKGIDVVTTTEQSLLSAPDDAHWAAATSQGRVVVTNDVDFLALAARAGDHPGVVFCNRERRSVGEIIQFLSLVHGVYTSSDMRGRVEYA